VELLPHSYTNHTTREGSVVTKSYQGPDASRRCAREAAALSALAGRLPVPPVIDRSDTVLRLGFMHGVPGQELIDDGLAGQVLRACGQLLRRIHAIGPAELDLLSRHEDPWCWCMATTGRKTSCSTRRPRRSSRWWTGNGSMAQIRSKTWPAGALRVAGTGSAGGVPGVTAGEAGLVRGERVGAPGNRVG